MPFLFLITFLSATILPLSSEIVVLSYLTSGESPYLVWMIASLGNVFGGATNYFLGRLFSQSKWVQKAWNHPRMTTWIPRIQQRGSMLAFFGFLPIIGDPLLICMGTIQTPWIQTLMWMTLGKTVRYGILIYPFL